MPLRWTRRRRRALDIVGLLGLIALAALSCAAREPYRIGVVLGEEGNAGARAAVDAINREGGIHGHPVELTVGGGGSDGSAERALAAAEKLAGDPQVLAVVGHANSSASLAASQVYNAAHIPQVAPTTTAPIFSRAGPYSFRLVPSDESQAEFLASTLAADRPERLAIVYVNDDYGRALRQLVDAALARKGLHPAFEAPYVEVDTASSADLVDGMARRNATTLLWLGRASFFRHVMPRLRKALPSVQVLASDSFGGQAVEMDRTHVFDGVRYVRFVDVTRTDSAMQAFRRDYAVFHPGNISDEAVMSYDAVRTIALGLGAVGNDRVKLRQWLSELGARVPAARGVSGTISFADTTTRVSAYHLRVVAPAVP